MVKLTWIEAGDGSFLRCFRTNDKTKPYRYEQKSADGNILAFGVSDNPPIKLGGGDAYNYLKKIADSVGTENAKNSVDGLPSDATIKAEIDKHLIYLKNKLDENIESEAQQDIQNTEKKEKEIQEKYNKLNARFEAYCEEKNMTPLELIIATSSCLGVGNPREIINAFFGYFQTYAGIKSTNVIAVGSQASGKSFMLENALSMIPQEKVERGVDTVAYFFNKYNGKKLDGYIFFMGDLGGDLDNQDTLKLRDTLKELTTDGFKKRGVMNTDLNEEEDQVVRGYPCLSYTTANESIINEQEKSRSIILTPQLLDTKKITIYNSLKDAKGEYYKSLNLIKHITNSIQGFVYNYEFGEKDFFNPYMFVISDYLANNEDFTRKEPEYIAVLKLVTCLHKPFELTHEIYPDKETSEHKSTSIVVASMQDNINALNIFSSLNLLPDEILFANGLIKEYDVVNTSDFDYEIGVENFIKRNVDGNEQTEFIDRQTLHNETLENSELPLKEYFFTVESLKKNHRNKRWFRKTGSKLVKDRLMALYEEGILIKVGKIYGRNHIVYGLNKGRDKPIEEVIPEFKKELIQEGLESFKKSYPNHYDELVEFVKNDKSSNRSLFEMVEPIVPDLPYLDGD